MFERFNRSQKEAPYIDPLIDRVVEKMHESGAESENFPKMLGSLERLHKLKTHERRNPVSLDTVAIVGGNLLITLLIVAYEQKHVITSKGFAQMIPLSRRNS